MKNPPPEISVSRRFPWRIFCLAGGILLAWLGILEWRGLKADLAESNLQANLIRITRYWDTPEASIVLLGSSVAGRLLPEYFADSGLNIANLGLDGSRPLFGFEVLERKKTYPDILLLDTSTLFQPIQANDATLRQAMDSPTAKLSQHLPFFRPDARPSSVVYEKIKAWRDKRGGGVLRKPFADAEAATSQLPPTYDEVKSALIELQKKGSRVIFVEIPRGEGWATPKLDPATLLAKELDLEYWAPGPALYQSGVQDLRFSDGLHLTPASARKVSEWIATRLQDGKISPPKEQPESK